ncbi:ankyrin repeat and LEM domain-containing protein 1 [Drosophila navojoa]|uniref:ankyrin repeat and LEM domain-containing protein 1 n=1 Tax=Drosophila navojoa TaxID=7232 RepID=UPI0011BF8C33|nr:ankyrin repeat and LEM domain-containing protein 1 [Drosophila navojoa]
MYKLLVAVLTMLRDRPLVHQFVQIRGIKYSLGELHVPSTSFSHELQYTLQSESSFASIGKHSNLVKRHRRWFSRHDKSKRLFFNYLLLDSRITDGLRNPRAKYLHKVDVWLTFLRSIFYVGKGKAARPYVHLYQAHKLLRSANPVILAKDPKLALIVHLWQQNRGVVLLRSFSGISSNDAHTREAAMIDALGINHLTNRRVGVYFGVARSKFTKEQRRLMGVLLLYRLLMVYLKNEECELRPEIVSLKHICHQ